MPVASRPSLHSPDDASSSERVLLLLPGLPRDSSIERILRDGGFRAVRVDTIDVLFRELRDGAGVVVVTDQAVTEEAVQLLVRTLNRRPPWSNLPIIVLTQRQPQSLPGLGALDLFASDTGGNLTILEYPVHPMTLTSVVQSALRARRRQYQVRDLLEGLEEKNRRLAASEDALREANATLEQRVARRTQQVRDLALAITTAEQRERNRISQILHDHLQQIIHSAKMWAELAASEPSTQEEGLPRLVELLDEAQETTRSLTVELNPPILEKKGLAAALEWLADHMDERHGLTVELDVAPSLRIPNPDLRPLLFQLTRELLFNVVKHAEVDRATLHASIHVPPSAPSSSAPSGIPLHTAAVDAVVGDPPPAQGQVRIVVEDQGKGFDPQTTAANGHGLVSIRERLELVGGAVHIDTAPGQGTRVTLTVPVTHSSSPTNAVHEDTNAV